MSTDTEDYISNQSEAENSRIEFYKQKEEEYYRKKNSANNKKRMNDQNQKKNSNSSLVHIAQLMQNLKFKLSELGSRP